MIRNVAAMYEITTLPDKASANDDASAGVWSVPCFRTKVVKLVATLNTLTVTLQKSVDGGTDYENIEAPFDVTIALPVTKTYTDPYTHIKVIVKSKTTDQSGTLATRLFGTWI